MSKVSAKHKQCVHHWIIDAADSKTSFGRCKYCGLVKAFSNEWQNPYIKKDIPADGDDPQPDI
jgi:hypothetical protein